MLEVRNLSVAYGGLRALSDVSLSVGERQFVTLVGPNGAGKSTLFKTISGVVAPVSGAISFAGQDLLARRPSDRAHLGIAHVPEARQVFKTLTVRENLEMGAYPKAGHAHWAQTLEAAAAAGDSGRSQAALMALGSAIDELMPNLRELLS